MTWLEYFVGITKLVSLKSTCIRRKVGAIAVYNKHIIATGYNGAPSGLKHCSEIGCIREQKNIPSGQNHEICRGVHAEQNVIIQAALHGLSLKDSDIYCTNMPCVQCAKMLINCHIKSIYYLDNYDDELAKQMLEESDIQLINIKSKF